MIDNGCKEEDEEVNEVKKGKQGDSPVFPSRVEL